MDFNKYYNMEEYPQNLNGMDFSKDLFVYGLQEPEKTDLISCRALLFFFCEKRKK